MGVNGSGKHCNWSMGTDTGINLFSPGKDREDNLRFITFVVNSLMAVYKYNALLKASIASATNAHRLGRQRSASRHHLILLRNTDHRNSG